MTVPIGVTNDKAVVADWITAHLTSLACEFRLSVDRLEADQSELQGSIFRSFTTQDVRDYNGPGHDLWVRIRLKELVYNALRRLVMFSVAG